MMGPFAGRLFDRSTTVFVAVVAAVAIVVPFCNLLFPPSSPLHVPTYLVALFGKYICYALLALAIDLIWGYCGILSLGHGAFFALGGYAMGMYLMRQIGTRGVYADPILPDFMVFLNWPELPVYWYGFQHFPYALLMIMLVPGALAFVFGWFAFRSRVTGVYLSIITQALTFALLLGFFRNNFGFGGNNGLTDFKDILGFNVQAAGTRAALFSTSCLALILGFLICRAIIASKLGKVLIAIRDAEARVRFLGYRVESYKLFVFTLSACMAGVAGALYVPQVGIINPSEFSPANSIEAVIWVAVGGRGTLIGAVVGAVLVNYAKTSFTGGTLVPYWHFGTVFLAAVVWMAFMKREAIAGVIAGVVVAGIGALIAQTQWAADVAGSSQLLGLIVLSWPFVVAVVCIVAAMARSWEWRLLGAISGALVVGFFGSPSAVLALAPYWLFALGGLFIAVTLLLPKGIVGTAEEYFTERQRSVAARRVAVGAPPASETSPRPAE